MTLRYLLLFLTFLSSFIAIAENHVESVSILTCGPGNEVYELEGHTALRLRYTDGQDLTVNWGTFDFNSPNFLYRFVKGETDYRMAVVPYSVFLRQYAYEGRSLHERQIHLDQKEMDRLSWLIDSTLTKGSPVYRYNYVKDNCATRPLDYIELAMNSGVTLKDTTALSKPGRTFREDMTAFHSNYPWYQFGIDLALGSGIDFPLSYEEHRFAPSSLELMVDGATRDDKTGREALVFGPSIEILKEQGGGPLDPTPLILRPIFVCWLYFAIVAFISLYDWKHKKITLWIDSFYYSLVTLAGLLLTFLIFISVHEATSPNWLYLWLNPLCIIGAILVWIKSCRSAVICWQMLNFVAIIALGVLALVKVQALNVAFIPLMTADALRALLWVTSAKWVKN